MKNQVLITGRLGRDPQMLELPKSKAKVVKFSLAYSNNYKDKSGNWQSDTEWYNVEAWGNQGERIMEKARKGTEVIIEGKIRCKQYEDKDGNKRTYVSIKMDNFNLLQSTSSTQKLEPAEVAQELEVSKKETAK